MTINSINSNIPIEIAKGGTNATAMTNTNGVNYFDGTRLVTTAVGTATHVLTSNGAGLAPTFQAGGGGGGGITTIAGDTGTATGATITFDASPSAGGTVSFTAAGSTVTLDVTSGDTTSIGNGTGVGTQNTNLGKGAGAGFTMDPLNDYENVAIGFNALRGNGVAYYSIRNVVIGALAAQSVTELFINNVIIGHGAVAGATAQVSNSIIIGQDSGSNLITGVNGCIYLKDGGVDNEFFVIAIGSRGGSYDATYIQGIAGKAVANNAAVLINTSTGQLGTAVSSERYKKDIVDMEDTSRILNLRPVNFVYKDNKVQDKQYGLIAEEVADIMPELVSYNKEGQPESVHYHDLPVLLLAEIKKLNARITALESK